MGRYERISTDLPDYMVSELRSAVESGEFASTDEAVREALTHWLGARAMGAVKAEDLRVGLQREVEGPGRDADAVFDRLQALCGDRIEASERKA